jgi:hypothetical protein
MFRRLFIVSSPLSIPDFNLKYRRPVEMDTNAVESALPTKGPGGF